MKSKISLITLGVSDLKKSLIFYRDGLGFKTHNYKEGEDVVFFKMEGSWLSLFCCRKARKPRTNLLLERERRRSDGECGDECKSIEDR